MELYKICLTTTNFIIQSLKKKKKKMKLSHEIGTITSKPIQERHIPKGTLCLLFCLALSSLITQYKSNHLRIWHFEWQDQSPSKIIGQQKGILSPHKGRPLNFTLFTIAKQNPHQTSEGLHKINSTAALTFEFSFPNHISYCLFSLQRQTYPFSNIQGCFIRLAAGTARSSTY